MSKDKIHELNVMEWFIEDIAEGRKRFEVRDNERLYQTGDLIHFRAVDGKCLPTHVFSVLDQKTYRITFVESGYGLKEGYVAFGFDEVDDER